MKPMGGGGIEGVRAIGQLSDALIFCSARSRSRHITEAPPGGSMWGDGEVWPVPRREFEGGTRQRVRGETVGYICASETPRHPSQRWG